MLGVVVGVFTLKTVPISLYPVPSYVRTDPTPDAVDSRGHRLTYPRKWVHFRANENAAGGEGKISKKHEKRRCPTS